MSTPAGPSLLSRLVGWCPLCRSAVATRVAPPYLFPPHPRTLDLVGQGYPRGGKGGRVRLQGGEVPRSVAGPVLPVHIGRLPVTSATANGDIQGVERDLPPPVPAGTLRVCVHVGGSVGSVPPRHLPIRTPEGVRLRLVVVETVRAEALTTPSHPCHVLEQLGRDVDSSSRPAVLEGPPSRPVWGSHGDGPSDGTPDAPDPDPDPGSREETFGPFTTPVTDRRVLESRSPAPPREHGSYPSVHDGPDPDVTTWCLQWDENRTSTARTFWTGTGVEQVVGRRFWAQGPGGGSDPLNFQFGGRGGWGGRRDSGKGGGCPSTG